jgi:cell division septation protein DedD
MAQRNMNQEPQIIRMAVTVPAPQDPDPIGVVTTTPTVTVLTGSPLAAERTEPAVERSSPTRTPPQLTPTPVPTRRSSPTASAAVSKPAEGGTWTVQVLASTDLLQAVILARQLRAKGYDAFTAEEKLGQVTWYRVRVGRYDTQDGAQAAEQRLRRQEQMEAAYVTKQ